ncbi:MAG: glycoside hydrolase domain-containing protein [Thermoguttaceae bacterium]
MRSPAVAAMFLAMSLSCMEVDAAAPKPIALTALNGMERIGQSEKPFGKSTVQLSAAKNEVESFQVVVAAPQTNLRIVDATMSDLVGSGGARLGKDCVRMYREEYVRVRCSTYRAELPPGLYADPLVPFVDPVTGKPIEPFSERRERWGEKTTVSGHDMFALPFDVYRGQNQPIWVDVRVPKDAQAGVYRGKFRVVAQNKKTAEIPVTLTVWDFTLPDGPTHRNHFGELRSLAKLYDVKPDSDRFREIEARYCQAMAEHRLNPPIPQHLLPKVNSDGSLTILPERHKALRKFMDDLHVTDIQVPCPRFAQLPTSTLKPDYKEFSPAQRAKAVRYYREFFDYLKQNGWDKRAYVYLLDEPNLRENYEQILVLGEMVHEAAPDLKRLVVEQTYPHDSSWPNIDSVVDIWCPLWAFIDRDTIRAKIAEGDEVFSYTALVQSAPRYHPHYLQVKDKDPPSWHIDSPTLDYRVPTWINRQYGITGLLYWSTVNKVIDPWFNPAFPHPSHYNGGGLLFYPGTPCGFDGPVASMRLKNIRDGMEDYEYFVLLEKQAGPEAVQKIVDRIAPNWWDYTRDPEAILAARQEIARKIQRGK